jgi:hypothetical protein
MQLITLNLISFVHEHYSDKLLKLYLAIAIDISHCDHLLNFLACEVTLQPLADFFQLALPKALFALNVKNFKRLEQLFLCLCILEFVRHKS